MQKAARVWPLGKLLLVGVRTVASRWSSGRCRSTAALTIRLTMRDENPAAAERDDGAPPVGPAPARLEPGQQHPDEAVVGQVGDDGGGAVDLGPPPQRLEGGVDRLVDGAHCRARSRGEGGAGGLEVAVVAQRADVGPEVLGIAGPLDGRPHGDGPPALAADGLLGRDGRDGDGLAQVAGAGPRPGRGPSRLSHSRA